MTFWDLPGPGRFLEVVERSLRSGINVVTRFPGVVRRGFADILTRNLEHVFSLSRFEARRHPLRSLCDRYAPSIVVDENDVGVICEDDAFRGRLIWLDGLNSDNWCEWREFLTRYAHICRTVSALGRPVFIAPLDGMPPGKPPNNDVAISVHDWSDVVGEMDILFWAYRRLLRRGRGECETQLLAMAVARVAGWDFDTAERLVDEEASVILSPVGMLRSFAMEKNWTLHTPSKWGLGTASGSGVLHAALAALHDPPREIERRMWSAQASVLLPRIDYWRSQFVAQNSSRIRRQLQHNDFGTRDPYELEIGKLQLVVQRMGCGQRVCRSVRVLRDARNALAHLRPLRPEQAVQIVRRVSL